MAVYFLADEAGRVKIGRAADIKRWLRQIQCGSGDTLSLARVVQGGAAVERWLHRRFAAQHLRGEWFRFDPGMLTVAVPDEVPDAPKPVRPDSPSRSLAEFFANADALGMLSDADREFISRGAA